MKYKLLGKQTGLFASEMALGTGNFGTAKGYGAAKDEARKIFHAYTEQGGNFIDTSDMYQLGEAETMIGDFITGNRSNYIIATKYARGNLAGPAPANTGNHRKAMRAAVEGSLRRLKTDYIDLYLAHFDDQFTPAAEIAGGLEDLVKSGKVLYTGLSNFSPWRSTAVAMNTSLTALQIEYNLLQRATEQEYFPMANELGLAIMGYSPMAGGLLTGKYRKGETGRMTMMGSVGIGTENEVLDVMNVIATELNATTGQVAIAWAKARGVFPIIGARTLEQLNACIGAAALELNAGQMARLNTATQPALVYPATLQVREMMPYSK
jgi:aryl-alcohol dehydrogenase-like predicted oxidoreductase